MDSHASLATYRRSIVAALITLALAGCGGTQAVSPPRLDTRQPMLGRNAVFDEELRCIQAAVGDWQNGKTVAFAHFQNGDAQIAITVSGGPTFALNARYRITVEQMSAAAP
jgi:hypothetical protein